MAATLLTDWGQYNTAARSTLLYAERQILIFDPDLGHLPLETPEISAHLSTLLGAPRTQVRIAVQHSATVQSRMPRLMNLLKTHSHQLEIRTTPTHLANLRDAMIIVDKQHALIRFDRDQARSKQISCSPEECAPYLKRFEDIWLEGGTPLAPTCTGL